MEKSGKLLRAELRHLGPIRMYILSGVKPGEIFMMWPTAAGGGGGGGDEEVEGSASGGRHAPVEWRGRGKRLLLPTQPAAERMRGWREERRRQV